jgi:hypothetical protein
MAKSFSMIEVDETIDENDVDEDANMNGTSKIEFGS